MERLIFFLMIVIFINIYLLLFKIIEKIGLLLYDYYREKVELKGNLKYDIILLKIIYSLLFLIYK